MKNWLLLVGLLGLGVGVWQAVTTRENPQPLAAPVTSTPGGGSSIATPTEIGGRNATHLAPSRPLKADTVPDPPTRGSDGASLLRFDGHAVYADGAPIVEGQVYVFHLYAGASSYRLYPPVVGELDTNGDFDLQVPRHYTDGRYGLVAIVDEEQEVYREVIPMDRGVLLYAAERAESVSGWIALEGSPVAGAPPAIVQAVTANERNQIWSRIAERTDDRLAFDFVPASIASPMGEEVVVEVQEVSRVEGVLTTAEARFASAVDFARAAEGGFVMICPENTVLVPGYAGQSIHRVYFIDSVRQRQSVRLAGKEGAIHSVLPGMYSVKGLVDGVQTCTGYVDVPPRGTALIEWRASLPGVGSLDVEVLSDGQPVEGAVISIALTDADGRSWCVASASNTTDDTGRVHIPGLPSGRGKLFARRDTDARTALAFEITVDRSDQSVTVNLPGERYCEIDLVLPGVVWQRRPRLDVFMEDKSGSAWTNVATGLQAQSVRVPSDYNGLIAIRCGPDWAGCGAVVAGVGHSRVSVPLKLLESLIVRTDRADLEVTARASPGVPQMPWAVSQTAPMRWKVTRFAGHSIELAACDGDGEVLIRHRVGSDVSGEISLNVE